jgi:hypothetical protein
LRPGISSGRALSNNLLTFAAESAMLTKLR